MADSGYINESSHRYELDQEVRDISLPERFGYLPGGTILIYIQRGLKLPAGDDWPELTMYSEGGKNEKSISVIVQGYVSGTILTLQVYLLKKKTNGRIDFVEIPPYEYALKDSD